MGGCTAASCETVQVTGGYDLSAGRYTEEGTRNGESLYVSADRSWELFFSEREDDDDRRRKKRRTLELVPEDLVIGGWWDRDRDTPVQQRYRPVELMPLVWSYHKCCCRLVMWFFWSGLGLRLRLDKSHILLPIA